MSDTRGTTMIAGHMLTKAQLRTLDELSRYMANNGGAKTRSLDIWGRSNQATAHRRNVGILSNAGVLKACGMEADNYGCITGVPHGWEPEVRGGGHARQQGGTAWRNI